MNRRRRAVLGVAASGVAGFALGALSGSTGQVDDAPGGADEAETGDERNGTRYVPPEADLDGIQAAIDEAGPNVTVELGRGEYVGSGLALTDGVQLRGAGRNATRLVLADGADTDLLTTPAPDDASMRQVGVRNLTLDGGNNSSGALVYGAFWNGRFVDCDFLRAPDVGFWLAGSTGDSTDDNVFERCRFIDGGGDALRQGGNRSAYPAVGVSRVQSCWFGHNAGHAVRLRGNANVVADCKFYGNGGVGVYVDRGTRNRVLNNDMAKETVEAPCVAVRAGQGVDATSNRVAGNVFDGSFREAVSCRTADDDSIVALQVHSNVVNATNAEPAAEYGIRAQEGSYATCSARHNTVFGEFEHRALAVPDSWTLSGNVVEPVSSGMHER